MPRREDDDVAQRYPTASARPRRHSLVLAGGFAVAVLATLAVFLTDNPQYLRVAVVAAAWAFVLATFAAGRRGSDRAAAVAREAELRSVYERELDREVTARREYELELENVLRRETEDAMRYELDALRGEIAAVASLRDEVARVTDLRGDLSALGGLRDEIARLAALRDDVASLGALRHDLGQMGELRADLGRMRDDLAQQLNDQLSSEMLVERIVMRTQGSRAEPAGRSVEGTASWAEDPPPRELTGGWPAIRLDEPAETRQFHELRRPEPVRPAAPPMTPPPTTPGGRRIDGMPSWAAESAAFDLFGPAGPSSAPRTDARWDDEPPHSRHAAAGPATQLSPIVPSPPAEPLRPSPRPRPTPHPTGAHPLPEVPSRRRRTGEAGGEPATGEQPSGPRPLAAARPAVPPAAARPVGPPPPAPRAVAPQTVANPIAPPPASGTGPSTGNSVAQILAQNGGRPATGSRRRRRYREDDEADDVLARVLREN